MPIGIGNDRVCKIEIKQISNIFGADQLSAIVSNVDGSVYNVVSPFSSAYVVCENGDYLVDIDSIFVDYPNVAFVVFDFGSLTDGWIYHQSVSLDLVLRNGAVFFDSTVVYTSFGLYKIPKLSVLSSLNGDYYSYPDGSKVICYPRSDEFIVQKSYLSAYDQNSLSVTYDLISSDGKKHTAPHAFLSKSLVKP